MYIISNYLRGVFLKLPSHQEIVSRNRLSSKNVMINKLAKVFINCKAGFYNNLRKYLFFLMISSQIVP